MRRDIDRFSLVAGIVAIALGLLGAFDRLGRLFANGSLVSGVVLSIAALAIAASTLRRSDVAPASAVEHDQFVPGVVERSGPGVGCDDDVL